MLDLRGNDVPGVRDKPATFSSFDGTRLVVNRPSDKCIHGSKNSVIVGFSAAAGKDDFLRPGADQCSDLFAGGFDGGASVLAGGVDGRGVSELGGEIGKHGVENLRVDGGRGVVIEIDAVHRAVLRILRVTGNLRRGYGAYPSSQRGVFFVSAGSKGFEILSLVAVDFAKVSKGRHGGGP